MYPYSRLPQPLAARTFYVLLALSRKQLHVYALKGAIFKDSLGSMNVSVGQLYPLVTRLHDEGLIDLVGRRPTDASGKERLHYGISAHGTIVLKEEFMRLEHALKIGAAARLLNHDEMPTDIQRLLLDVPLD